MGQGAAEQSAVLSFLPSASSGTSATNKGEVFFVFTPLHYIRRYGILCVSKGKKVFPRGHGQGQRKDMIMKNRKVNIKRFTKWLNELKKKYGVYRIKEDGTRVKIA